jgi:hypothetical protein
MIMENQQTAISKAYRDAQINGFNGSIHEFVVKYGSRYRNDIGASASALTTDENSFHQQENNQAPVQEPITRPMFTTQPEKKLAPISAVEDDKILGMNKTAFYILCATGVVAIAIAAAMIMSSLRKKTAEGTAEVTATGEAIPAPAAPAAADTAVPAANSTPTQ